MLLFSLEFVFFLRFPEFHNFPVNICVCYELKTQTSGKPATQFSLEDSSSRVTLLGV